MSNHESLSALSNQMADAVETFSISLVTVNGRERQSASGIVIASDLVLTADHVLERDNNLSIHSADGRMLSAQLVGRDPSTDLAVLRVADLHGVPASAASSSRVGQWALAVGRPSNEGVMASAGIVSAIGGPIRAGRGQSLERYIRTDAIPYPGFSGGGLIDAYGAAYGLLTTGLARGAAIVIPMDIAQRVANTITQHGYVKRGYLGVVTQQVRLPQSQRANASQEGALLVVRVEDNSPAEKGGLLVGDVLVAIDGQTVNDADDLLGMLSGDRVGKSVPILVLRGGQKTTLNAVIGQRS